VDFQGFVRVDEGVVRLAQLAVHAEVGKASERPAQLARKFIASIDALNDELGIPRHLDALVAADIPALAKAACWEADTNYPVPRYMSPETCAGILREVLPPTRAPARKSAKPKR
jgi:alcohol dehydrogenase class IV